MITVIPMTFIMVSMMISSPIGEMTGIQIEDVNARSLPITKRISGQDLSFNNGILAHEKPNREVRTVPAGLSIWRNRHI
jgi:hypothetical protein